MKKKIHHIPVSESELVVLMHELAETGNILDLAFGPSGVAIQWEEGKPMPASVEMIGMMRGVLNENMNGAGI